MQRYIRQMTLPEMGDDGQGRLADARVAIVGVGGLGAPAALYLAAAGIGHLTLIDPDEIAMDNLHRQVLYREDDVGRLKVLAARDNIHLRNAGIAITPHAERLTAANATRLLAQHDIILDGLDDPLARDVLNVACREMSTPWIQASVSQWCGELAYMDPRHGPCYRCLFPEIERTPLPSCADTGVLGPVVGTIALWQATLALRYLIGDEPPVGSLWTWDAKSFEQKRFNVPVDDDCVVCGEKSLTLASFPREATPQDVWEHSKSDSSFVAWDLRSEEERALAGTIPKSRVVDAANLENEPLPPAEAYFVLICARGRRAAQAARVLQARGHPAPRPMLGGIASWRRAGLPLERDSSVNASMSPEWHGRCKSLVQD